MGQLGSSLDSLVINRGLAAVRACWGQGGRRLIPAPQSWGLRVGAQGAQLDAGLGPGTGLRSCCGGWGQRGDPTARGRG